MVNWLEKGIQNLKIITAHNCPRVSLGLPGSETPNFHLEFKSEAGTRGKVYKTAQKQGKERFLVREVKSFLLSYTF